jgi:hypothetical protein
VTATLTLATPGWTWVPRVLRSRRYWRVVARFALLGPLIGGAPYAVLVFTLPFMYLIGLVPAALAGMLFGAWLLAPGKRHPHAAWRAAVGLVCGALACAAIALIVAAKEPLLPWLFLSLHGAPAALVLALTYRHSADRQR